MCFSMYTGIWKQVYLFLSNLFAEKISSNTYVQ